MRFDFRILAVPQCFAFRFASRLLLNQRVAFSDRGGVQIRSRRRLSPYLDDEAAEPVVLRLSLTRWPRLSLGQGAGVSGVVGEERHYRAACVGELLKLFAIFVEPSKPFRNGRDEVTRDGGERFGERVGEQSFAGTFGQLWRPNLQEEVDEGVVATLSESEESFIDRQPVVALRVVDVTGIADSFGQPLAAEGEPTGVDQGQLVTNTLRSDEEPGLGQAATACRFEAGSDGEEVFDAVFVSSTELQPGVPDPFGMWVLAAEEKVPFHAFGGVGIRFDPPRGRVSVEEERQGEGEHLRLAGSIVAPKQQPAVTEGKLLVFVEEQIDESEPKRLPTQGARHGQAGVWLGCHGRRAPVMVGASTAKRARAARERIPPGIRSQT